jgi:hypothetical protein
MSIKPDLTTFLDLMQQHSYEAQRRDESLFKSFVQHYGALCDYSETARPAQRNRLLKQLAAGVEVPDLLNAGVIANLCGIFVENGADPSIAVDAVLRRLTEQLAAVERLARRLRKKEKETVEFLCEDLWELRRIRSSNKELYPVWAKLGKPSWRPGSMSAEFKAWMAMRDMVCPAMAMLCRSMAARQAARHNSTLVRRACALAGINRYADYLAEVLTDVDATLLILHPGQKAGFRVVAEGIQVNFQLFNFLQEELIGDPDEGKLAPSWQQAEEAAADAGDDAAEACEIPLGYNTAAWTYYQWTGLRPDGSFAPFSEFWHRVLGEQTPLDILPFDGEPVVILGPCEIPMSWEGFLFPDLHDAYVRGVRVVEKLSPAEVRAWLRRIRKAPREE